MEKDRKVLRDPRDIKGGAYGFEPIVRAVHELIPPKPYPRQKKKQKLGATILVIPDAHSKPQFPNHRFEWLGRLVTDILPDYIVDIGDWFDMHSLNNHSRGASFHGASYWEDISAGIDARLRFAAQIDDYNRGKRSKTKYKPELIFCHGNHENRIARFIAEEEPRLEGIISTDDFRSVEFGWEEIPFLETKNILGCNFSHYFTSGVMSRPISGMHQASSMISKRLGTCIQGHTHTFDHSIKTSGEGKHIHGVVVGCFLEKEQREDWAGPANDMWRKGVVVLRNVDGFGDFDLEWIGIDRIKHLYS